MQNSAIKSQREIDAIKRCALITDNCFEQILQKIKGGITEIELAQLIVSTLKKLGADGEAFDTIVAFGESGAEMHHIPTARALRAGDFITVDFGAYLDEYCSDFTRTFAYKYANEKMARVYEIVKTAQQLGLAKVKANVKCADVDFACRDYISKENYGEYFIHGTGHGVGKQIHEAPTLNRTSEEILENNMVITIEPGIYIKDIGGVRIEDMIVVGERKPLSRHPKELVILS